MRSRRAFVLLSRLMAPLIRRGIIRGNRWSGSLLVLRTRGRRSGLWREAALDFAAAPDGVLVAAGWGAATRWYGNLVADPHVAVSLGGPWRPGTARTIEDPAERVAALRAVLRAAGAAGRGGGLDPGRDPDEAIAAHYAGIPVVHVRFDDR
jgi:deazaflavin-dependent oxidoreductase (nitroreductase family)